MNRSFPPEESRPCENCGHDIIVVALPDGGYEANDYRDFVDAESPDERDHRFVCHRCRAAVGIDDADDVDRW